MTSNLWVNFGQSVERFKGRKTKVPHNGEDADGDALTLAGRLCAEVGMLAIYGMLTM
jgi:hypothetical protein